jgi:DNA-binding LacI/PurR family transcriptional regulator
MTVSRALRNHPEVSSETKAVIRKIAASARYIPDPDLSRLMSHLRQGRRPAFKASLVALTDHRPGMPVHPYVARIKQGAEQRANELGYSLDLMQMDEEVLPRRRLQHILVSRGIEGLLLLPMDTPRPFDRLLQWDEFAVVAATSSVASPDFHQVMPRHFTNTLDLCRELTARGYRRIGLVIDELQDLRVNHTFTGAMARHGLFDGGEFVPPFLAAAQDPTRLRAWFKQQKPDALVVGREDHIAPIGRILGLRIPGKVAFASTSTAQASGTAGIDERPAEIGRASIDLLTSMIQRGEKGVPAVAASTMIAGHWVDGESCRRRRSAPR